VAVGDVFPGHGNLGYWSNTNAGSNNYSSTDAVNFFFAQQMGYRWDNSVKYTGNFSGVTVGAMVMPGNIPGGVANLTSGLVTTTYGYIDKNAMISGSLGYNSKDLPISLAVAVQYEADASYNHHFDVGGGVKYALNPQDGIYLFYIYSAFDSNFARINSNDSELSSGGVGRQDNIVNLGANYYVLPSLNLLASLYFDYAQNVLTTGDDGERYSGLLAVDYYFSKDFDVYIGAWYTQFGDALENSANGGDAVLGVSKGSATNVAGNFSSVFGAMLGMRVRF
jgi:predicted porin